MRVSELFVSVSNVREVRDHTSSTDRPSAATISSTPGTTVCRVR